MTFSTLHFWMHFGEFLEGQKCLPDEMDGLHQLDHGAMRPTNSRH